MKVILEFKSPLLIGGKKNTSNFINTDDVIKGSVIRAAFAKVILNNCPFRNEKIDGKVNWIQYREDKCSSKCEFKNICKKFSDIHFSYFYPEGSEVVPLTAKLCKTDKKHGYIDCLIDDDKCKKCKGDEDGRTEFKTGLRTVEKNKEQYKVEKTVCIKTSINPYTRTSSDGMLYSVETITATGKNDLGEKICIYEGDIENLTKDELDLFKRLRVGGDTTVGLGKCELKVDNSNKTLDIDMDDFCKRYISKNHIKNKDKNEYAAIKFIGDLKVDFKGAEQRLRNKKIIDDDYITTDEYKKIWEEALGVYDNLEVNIDRIYTDFINYRGYDTFKGNNKRSNAYVMATKGTVIVFKGKNIKEFLEKHTSKADDSKKGVKMSFGYDTEVGFGNYVLYDGR